MNHSTTGAAHPEAHDDVRLGGSFVSKGAIVHGVSAGAALAKEAVGGRARRALGIETEVGPLSDFPSEPARPWPTSPPETSAPSDRTASERATLEALAANTIRGLTIDAIEKADSPATPACRWAWPTPRRCCGRGS